MTKQTPNEFMKWLDRELEHRGWSDNQLAKQSGVNSSSISRVRSGTAPGWELTRAIARALDVPDVFILRMVGLIDPIPNETLERQEWVGLIDGLGLESVRDMIEVARTMREQKSKVYSKKGK